MKIRFVPAAFTASVMLCTAGFAQTMLYQQGFETPLAQNPELESGSRTLDGVTYPTQAIVSHMPREGSKSLRGNFNRNYVDPITGLRGHEFTNMIVDFKKVPKLKNWYATTDQIYVSWWFKLDQVKWRGTDFNSSDPIMVSGKFAYLLMNKNPATSYYFTMNGGATGQGTVSTNDSGWMQQWQNLYSRPSLSSLRSGKSFGADGQWHKLGFYIYKNEAGERRLKWWMDDQLMTRDIFENGSGDYRISDDFVMDGIQFWHTATGNLGLSTSVGAPDQYLNGWQIDDLQVWDGIPPVPEPGAVALISIGTLPFGRRRRGRSS